MLTLNGPQNCGAAVEIQFRYEKLLFILVQVFIFATSETCRVRVNVNIRKSNINSK